MRPIRALALTTVGAFAGFAAAAAVVKRTIGPRRPASDDEEIPAT